MSQSVSLPPYSALPPGAPPSYSREAGENAETITEEHPSTSESDHCQHDPPPSILNDDQDQLLSAALPRIQEHYILTIIMMVLCGVLLNPTAFLCLLPALSFSKKAASAKQRGEYMEARTNSQWSLWLNIAALVSYLALMILGVGLLLVALLSL